MGQVKDNEIVHYIRKLDYMPIGFFTTGRYENMWDYQFYTIKYCSINIDIPYDSFKVDTVMSVSATIPSAKEIKKIYKGQTAPFFEAPLHNGKNINTEDLEGKIVILDFWYRGCPPCLKAIPDLVSIDEAYRDKGVVILGINPHDNAQQIEDFFKYKGVKYNSTFLSKDIAEQYGINAYPTVVIIDQNGKIYKIHEGWDDRNYKKNLVKDIEKLLKDK